MQTEKLTWQRDLPMLMVYGAQTPSRSRAEMEALASVPSIRSAKLPLGKLSVHEEFPDLVTAAVEPSSDPHGPGPSGRWV